MLVNSNPATIMTDPEMADVTYIEPITWQMVASIIDAERPDALLPTWAARRPQLRAGSGARRRAREVQRRADRCIAEAIDKAEDREKFKAAMTRIGLGSARSGIAHHRAGAARCRQDSAFPLSSARRFTLGGTGGGIAYNREEFVEIVQARAGSCRRRAKC